MPEKEEEVIFVPSDEDRDEDAEEEMQMGKRESLRDPWFDSDQAALDWTPDGGDS